MKLVHPLKLAAALALLALPVHGTGCSAKPVGQIVLVVQTDMSIPKDIDTISIDVSNNSAPKFHQDYDKIGPDHDEIQLPGTISLVASPNPADVITILVTARTGGASGVPHVVRKVITTIPSTRVVMLPLGIHFLCNGQATTDTSGNAASTCPDGETCIAGICQVDALDSAQLDDYTPAAVTGDGTCFDPASCWTAPAVATVDYATCTIPPVTGVNIALQTEGVGICGPVGCFVTLDQDDPIEGWTVGSDGRITLPAGVCVQLKSGQIVNVVTQPTSANCSAKKLALPTCGPWSAASKNPAPYTGPLALAGGQARPVTMALQSGNVFWSNGGVGSVGGSLKSIGPGGGVPTAVQSSSSPRSLIASGTNELLWTDAPGTPGTGAIYHSIGTTLGPPLVAQLDSPEGLTKVGAKLFWTDFQDGAIYTSDDAGMGVAKLVAGANYPYRVTADANYVYWTNEGTMGMTPPDGSVARYQYTTATGDVETLAPGQLTPRAIALDTVYNAVYWANFDPNGSIMRVRLGGTPAPPEVIAKDQAYPNGIALDGDYVYWTNREEGTINRQSIFTGPSTPPTVLAKGQAAPGTIALDASFVYWLNEGSSSVQTGAIMKLPKAP